MVRFKLDVSRPRRLTDEGRAFFAGKSEDEIEAIAGDPEYDASTDDQLIGARLSRLSRRIRSRRKLTLEDLSARTGVPAGTIRQWEEGPLRSDPAALILMTIYENEPEAVERALLRSRETLAE